MVNPSWPLQLYKYSIRWTNGSSVRGLNRGFDAVFAGSLWLLLLGMKHIKIFWSWSCEVLGRVLKPEGRWSGLLTWTTLPLGPWELFCSLTNSFVVRLTCSGQFCVSYGSVTLVTQYLPRLLVHYQGRFSSIRSHRLTILTLIHFNSPMKSSQLLNIPKNTFDFFVEHRQCSTVFPQWSEISLNIMLIWRP